MWLCNLWLHLKKSLFPGIISWQTNKIPVAQGTPICTGVDGGSKGKTCFFFHSSALFDFCVLPSKLLIKFDITLPSFLCWWRLVEAAMKVSFMFPMHRRGTLVRLPGTFPDFSRAVFYCFVWLAYFLVMSCHVYNFLEVVWKNVFYSYKVWDIAHCVKFHIDCYLHHCVLLAPCGISQRSIASLA